MQEGGENEGDDDLESQFAFDYMHRNKRLVEFMLFFAGLFTCVGGWCRLESAGYIDEPIFVLCPMFFCVFLVFSGVFPSFLFSFVFPVFSLISLRFLVLGIFLFSLPFPL